MSDNSIAFLSLLEDIINDRIRDDSDSSYTASLIAAGDSRIAQKVGEEALELALASVGDDIEEVLNEAADLMYHLLVLLANKKLRLATVAARLKSRHFRSPGGG